MQTPNTPIAKSTLHPLMVIAALAVILFCGVGAAAIMGWLPSSNGSGHDSRADSALAPLDGNDKTAMLDQPAGKTALAPQGSGSNASQHAAPAPAREQEREQPVAQTCRHCGVVQSVREISTRAQGSGVGAAGGAIVGGLLGNQVGSGHGRQLATVAGAIGGAVAGNQIEGNVNAKHSWEIVVRMDDGSTRTLHQGSRPSVGNGDPVRIVNGQVRAQG
ncbi:glycine zipper 2TM domain-containing protein [Oxalobacteraceae bacterium]|nr:glycine zipper 2TM domain-containing protein [Oxalobacteraceae bacterium]